MSIDATMITATATATQQQTFKQTIGDGIGFVELLDVFGDDLTVVNAARVSFNKESNEMNTQDERLVGYLARNHHITPFFHPQIRFRLKMPIFVAREWFRHQIGLARNEVSRRYVDFDPEMWLPVEGVRARDPNLKQGSKKENVADNDRIFGQMESHSRDTLAFYKQLLADGVAPEIARAVLPQSMYTEFIETGSLAAYARICGLRLDPHAQKEIQDYAQLVSDALETAFPVSWKALTGPSATELARQKAAARIVELEAELKSTEAALIAATEELSLNRETIETCSDALKERSEDVISADSGKSLKYHPMGC